MAIFKTSSTLKDKILYDKAPVSDEYEEIRRRVLSSQVKKEAALHAQEKNVEAKRIEREAQYEPVDNDFDECNSNGIIKKAYRNNKAVTRDVRDIVRQQIIDGDKDALYSMRNRGSEVSDIVDKYAALKEGVKSNHEETRKQALREYGEERVRELGDYSPAPSIVKRNQRSLASKCQGLGQYDYTEIDRNQEMRTASRENFRERTRSIKRDNKSIDERKAQYQEEWQKEALAPTQEESLTTKFLRNLSK